MSKHETTEIPHVDATNASSELYILPLEEVEFISGGLFPVPWYMYLPPTTTAPPTSYSARNPFPGISILGL